MSVGEGGHENDKFDKPSGSESTKGYGGGCDDVDKTSVRGRKGKSESMRGVLERISVNGIKGRLTEWAWMGIADQAQFQR